MKGLGLIRVVLFFLFVAVLTESANAQVGPIKFTVSMENPSTHYYHVVMECKEVNPEYLDFKLPAWTPGYYWLVNFSKNVVRFKAVNEQGNELFWNKTTKNTWHVSTGKSKMVIVSYDVYAFTQSVADPFLDDDHAYISTAGLLMHLEGQLQHPTTITLKPYSDWKKISTGLDPVAGELNTFSAPDFDALYDCPILMGNQEVVSFEVKGIPHYIAMEEPEKFDIPKFTADLKKMIEAAVTVVGEIPYKHYTFIIMGDGRGGLEHRNSTAVFSSGSVYNNNDIAGYKRWLNFLTHEYFHLYNIKAIRPIALGPFNYDQENYTNMLWVSEGFTVYYEYLILNRAGILTRDECLEFLRDNIRSYENIPGHLFQSATESSFDTWIQFFNRNENASNTTISYYDKGAALAMLMDLKIRHETQNKKSLDDVMRSLYQVYFKEKKRGFTDEEFRQTCEAVAGTSLQQLFGYASTVEEIDYNLYLSYAGLTMDTTPKALAGSYLGVTVSEKDGAVIVGRVEWNSPGWKAGVATGDVVLKINDAPASAKGLKELLQNTRVGTKIKLLVDHNKRSKSMDIVLGEKLERSFAVTPVSKPTPVQLNTLKLWLNN